MQSCRPDNYPVHNKRIRRSGARLAATSKWSGLRDGGLRYATRTRAISQPPSYTSHSSPTHEIPHGPALIDVWEADGNNIIEHLAGLDDLVKLVRVFMPSP